MAEQNDLLGKALDEAFGTPEQRLSQSLFIAQGKSPDVAAKQVQLADASGLPPDVVAANQKEIERRNAVAKIDLSGILGSSPHLGSWLQEQPNADISHDKIPVLQRMEGMLPTRTSDVGRAAGAGAVKGVGFTMRGIGDAIEITQSPALREAFKTGQLPWWLNPADIVRRPGKAIIGLGDYIGPDIERQNMATDIANAFGQLIPQVAGAVVAPTATPAMLFAQGVGSSAQSYEASGYADGPAKDIALLMSGSVTAVAEKFGLDVLLNKLPAPVREAMGGAMANMAIKLGMKDAGVAAAQAAGRVGASVAAEAGQEFVENFLNNVIEKVALNPDKSLTDGLQQQSVAAGGAAGIFRTLIETAAGVGRLRQRRNASSSSPEDTAQHVNGLNELASDPDMQTLNQRSPERLLDLARRIAGDTELYIPAEPAVAAFDALPQEAKDRLFAKNPELQIQLDEARITGADVSIPKSDYFVYVAPFSEISTGLAEHIKLDPNDLSIAEQKKFQELIKTNPALAADLEAQVNQATQSQAETDKTVAEVEAQVKAAMTEAKFTTAEAKSLAPLFARRAMVLAKASGKTAQDIISSGALEFRRVDSQGTEVARSSPSQLLIQDINRVATNDTEGMSQEHIDAVRDMQARLNARGIDEAEIRSTPVADLINALYAPPNEAQTLNQAEPAMGIDQMVNMETTPEGTIRASLPASTFSIDGIKRLQEAFAAGDLQAGGVINEIAAQSLQRLFSGVPAISVETTPSTGLYGGYTEPSLGVLVRFGEGELPTVVAGLSQFSQNFNQEQFHIRQATSEPAGYDFGDGSFSTPTFKVLLNRPLERSEIDEIIASSGLVGLTFNDQFVEAYHVGDPNDTVARDEFSAAIKRAAADLSGRGATSEIDAGVTRLWIYGQGHPRAIPYERAGGQLPAGPTPGPDPIAKLLASRYSGSEVKPFEQAPEITPRQRELQERIANIYNVLPDNDLKNPLVQRAYDELVDEVKEQYDTLPIKVEVWKGEGEPYKNSDEMRRDVQDRVHMWFYATTPDTFGPPGVDFSYHPLLKPTGIFLPDGHEMLANDLLRVVHDYYAHNMAPTNFGPRGEEAAWLNHMAMTKSPWARWALTTETRGQNSWVNFRSGAKDLPIKDRPFARQKAALLPIEFALTGNSLIDKPIAQLMRELDNTDRLGSADVSPPQDLDELGFYSKMHRFLSEKLNKSGTPDQYLEQVRAFAKSGQYKEEELFWSGLEEFLENMKEGANITVKLPNGNSLTYAIGEDDVVGEFYLDSQFKDDATGEYVKVRDLPHTVTKPDPQKMKVTKQEILDFLDNNRFTLEEVGENQDGPTGNVVEPITRHDFSESDAIYNEDQDYIEEMARENYYDAELEELVAENEALPEDEQESMADLEQRAMDRARDMAEEAARDSEYNYTYVYRLNRNDIDTDIEIHQMGGDNLFDVIIDGSFKDQFSDMPQAIGYIEEWLTDNTDYRIGDSEEGPQFEQYTGDGGENYSFFRLRSDNLPNNSFRQAGHYPEDNVLLHFRTKDRKGPNGERMLFIEEIQSDWHQAAYKNKLAGGPGYETEETMVRHNELVKKQREVGNDLRLELDAINNVIEEISLSVGTEISTPDVSLDGAHLKNAIRAYLNNPKDKEPFIGGDDAFITANLRKLRSIMSDMSGDQGEVVDMVYRRAAAKISDNNDVDWKMALEATLINKESSIKDAFGGTHDEAISIVRSLIEQAGEPTIIRQSDINRIIVDKAEPFLDSVSEIIKKKDALQAEENSISTELEKLRYLPKNAPFSKVWREVGFKRLLTKAQEGGYQAIGWTTGQQQNVRYNLSRFITNLGASLTGPTSVRNDGTDEPRWLISSAEVKRAADRMELETYKPYSYGEFSIDDRELDTLLGKDGADTVRNQASGPLEDGNTYHSVDFAKELEVGGDKKGNLYDVAFVQETKKILKKLDKSIDVNLIDYKMVEDGRDIGKIWYAPLTQKSMKNVQQGFELFQQENGSITIGKDLRRVIITLTQKANFSTGIHEFAHWSVAHHRMWANVLKDENTTEAKRLIDDWEALKKKVGATSDDFTVEQEEQVAKMFEVYMREGVAPAENLRTVFARFRNWLLQIYRDLTGLGVQLDDETRSIFDRWIAAEDEIAQVKKSDADLKEMGGMLGLSQQLDDYLASAKAQAEEKLFRHLDREQRALQRQAFHVAFEEERERVKKELEAKTPYSVVNYLKQNNLTLLDGPELDGVDPSLVSGDGIMPDPIADLFGYESGAAMIKDLRSAKNIDVLASRQAMQRLREKYPDMIENGRITANAMSAIYNDRVMIALDMLIKEMGRKADKELPSIRQFAKVLARNRAEMTQTKNLEKVSRYDVARDKEQKLALQSARSGDWNGAIGHLQRAMINHALFQEGSDFIERRQKFAQLVAKINRKDKKLPKSWEPDFVYAARSVLKKFGLSDTKMDAKQWFAEKLQSDPDIADHLITLSDLNISDKPSGDLTLSEYKQVIDTVENLIHVGRKYKEVTIAGRKLQMQEVVNTLASYALKKANGQTPAPLYSTDTWFQSTTNALIEWETTLIRIEEFCKWMDGGDINGPFSTYLYRPVSEAVDASKEAKNIYLTKLHDIMAPLEKTMKAVPINAPNLGSNGVVFKTKWDLMTALLNYGNAGNKGNLLDPEGNNFDDKILTRYFENHLTEDDVATVQKIWDLLEEIKPFAKAEYKLRTGLDLPEVEAEKFMLHGKEWRGGYYPLVADKRASVDNRSGPEVDTKNMLFDRSGSAQWPVTSRGFQKERTGKIYPVSLDISHVMRHIEDVLHNYHVGPALYQAARIINFQRTDETMDPVTGQTLRKTSKPFIEAIGKRNPFYKRLFTPWLQAVARNTVKDIGQKDTTDSFTELVRSRTIMALMGGNLLNAAQNYSSIPIVVKEIGKKAWVDGMGEYLRGPKQAHEFVAMKSLAMRYRYDQLDRDTQEVLNSIKLGGGPLSKGLNNIRNMAFWFQTVTDRHISTPTWIGAYRKALADGKSDRDAAHYADYVVRTTITSGDVKDTAMIQRGSQVKRIISMLYGYMNMVYNRNRVMWLDWKDGNMTGLEFISGQVMVNILPNLIAAATVDMLGGGGASADDEDWLTWYALRVFSGYFGLIPILRDMFSATQQGLLGGTFGDKMSSPIGSSVGGVGRGVWNLMKSAGNGDPNWDKITGDLLTGVSMATNLPTGFIKNPMRYIVDWMEGDAKPEGISDVATGLIAGPPPKK